MQFAEGLADPRPPLDVHCGRRGDDEAVDAPLCGHDKAAGRHGEGGDVGERVAAEGGPPPAAWARVWQVDGAVAGDGGLRAGAGSVRGWPLPAAGAEIDEQAGMGGAAERPGQPPAQLPPAVAVV